MVTKRIRPSVLKRSRRRGATIVEGAIVLGLFMTILFGLLDLSLAVLHRNMLTEGARRLAREVIVHGEKATPEKTAWGVANIQGTANDGTPYAECLRKALVTVELANVQYRIEWPDGANRPDDRVRVSLQYAYEPIVPFVLGSSTIPLTASTTMRIAH